MITPGNEDAFETYAAELSVATRAEAGCLSYHLHRHLNQKGRLRLRRGMGLPPGMGTAHVRRSHPRLQQATARRNDRPHRDPPPRTDRLRRQKA
nr:antibiotic biosynthesis monooxygenase [Sinorhizobium meliloti]